MDINQAFPSDFLKASDIQQPVIGTITQVKMEKAGDDTKPCVYFQEVNRGLLLNKTNANAITMLYGADTDRWAGQRIELYATTTDFRGEIKPCIRVRALQQQPVLQGGTQNAPVTNSPQQGTGQTNDAPSNFNPDVPPNDGWPGNQGR